MIESHQMQNRGIQIVKGCDRAQPVARTSINANNVQVVRIECVKDENVILREPQRLKDLPVTYPNERAKTSEFNALCEFYCLSYLVGRFFGR